MAYANPYDEYLQQMAQGGVPISAQAAPTTSPPNPALGWAGLGLDTVGSILGAYGQGEQASQARSDEMRQEGRTMAREDKLDAASEEERRRNALQSSGEYAGKSLEDILRNYRAYNASIGR